MSLKRGIEAAVEAAVEAIAQAVLQGGRLARTRSPRWPPSRPPTTRSAQMISEAIDKVGKDGVITVEESQTFGMEMDLVEGMRFDKGYISPYFVTDPERMEAVLDDAYLLLVGSKISSVRDLLPGAREGHADGQAAGDHRRGRRGRGPGHARGQQDPRHVQVRRRQGARLRRAAQGDAAGHGHPHRRPGHHRRGRASSSRTSPSTCWARPRRSSSPRTRPPSSRAAVPRTTSRAASTRSRPRSRTPTPTTTGRSCRSGWPSCPAASRCSRSAPPPRWS